MLSIKKQKSLDKTTFKKRGFKFILQDQKVFAVAWSSWQSTIQAILGSILKVQWPYWGHLLKSWVNVGLLY